ncbi:MAG: hypothetical protein WCK03_01350, partial [Candidatus Taylorbacteria bacterium]
PLGIMAFGMGFGMSQRTSIIANIVPNDEIGIASSILALARNIAGAFGIAIFGTILQNATKTKMVAISTYSSINSTDPGIIQQAIALISLKAQISAYGSVFIISAIIVGIGAVLALWIRIGKEETGKTKEAEVFVD